MNGSQYSSSSSVFIFNSKSRILESRERSGWTFWRLVNGGMVSAVYLNEPWRVVSLSKLFS